MLLHVANLLNLRREATRLKEPQAWLPWHRQLARPRRAIGWWRQPIAALLTLRERRELRCGA